MIVDDLIAAEIVLRALTPTLAAMPMQLAMSCLSFAAYAFICMQPRKCPTKFTRQTGSNMKYLERLVLTSKILASDWELVPTVAELWTRRREA